MVSDDDDSKDDNGVEDKDEGWHFGARVVILYHVLKSS